MIVEYVWDASVTGLEGKATDDILVKRRRERFGDFNLAVSVFFNRSRLTQGGYFPTGQPPVLHLSYSELLKRD